MNAAAQAAAGDLARNILDALPHHVIVLDAQGRVVATNEAWDRFSRHGSGGLCAARLGHNYLEACRSAARAGERDAQPLLEQLQQLLEADPASESGALPLTESTLEYAWPPATVGAAGPERWYLIRARRHPPEAGLVISHTDITRCKQAQLQLRDALQTIQRVIDGTDTLVYAKDLQGRYMLTNRSWRARTGLDEDQAANSTDERAWGPELAPALRANDERALASGALVVAEETASAYGEPATYLSSKFPLVNEQGKAYAVGGLSTDITCLKEAQAALQARERELQSLADNTPDVLIRFNTHGCMVFVNAAIQRMTGRVAREFIGRSRLRFADRLVRALGDSHRPGAGRRPAAKLRFRPGVPARPAPLQRPICP
jgi:PAS domain-containing protein